MVKDAEKFRRDREERLGGTIRFISYTRFLGEASRGKILNRGGILFVVNDRLYFEDFERNNTLMVMFGQKEEYSKTEFSMDLSDISIVKEIKEKDAVCSVQGIIDENEILPARKGIVSLFSKTILQVFVNNSPSLFLDLLDKEGFMKIVNEYMLRAEEN